MTALGFDTSNYTTSAALYDDVSDTARCVSAALQVADGALGLRQSDALFHHVKQLPGVLASLELPEKLYAIGVSTRPRAIEGSYMPCFLAGASSARMLSQALRVPVFEFSHQQGHLAAAAWSSGHPELLERDFLAWHVSGGTTELLIVHSSHADPCRAETIGGSRDLCAGQLIDRVGKLLGLPFPAGPALEALAGDSSIPASIRKNTGSWFNLSGFENKARQYLDDGFTPDAVARFTLDCVLACLTSATESAVREYPELPLLCAGGVMSNRLIKDSMERRFGAFFAKPEHSRDNALGVALLSLNAVGVTYE